MGRQVAGAAGDRRGSTAQRASTLLRDSQEALHRRTDRLFAGLMALQWLGALIAAWFLSPRTWSGAASAPHPNVWAALFLGGAFALLPIALAFMAPARPLTRHAIALCQMLLSALLVHVTGGRIETHFHVFGSLAFLAFYRDWRVLVTATVVVAAEHWVRGVYWPQYVYGVSAASPWRWVEHAGWVVFEDAFLLLAIRQSVREMRSGTAQQALLEEQVAQRERAEEKIARQNARLGQQNAELEAQQSELKEINARLEALATSDGLTGLKNHRAFQERLGDEFGRARRRHVPLSLALVDVDHFKAYNDAFGHPAGDEALKVVARVLMAESRDGDLVARYGGEEFAVLLPDTGARESMAAAERLRAAIAGGGWERRPVTASVGVATLLPATEGPGALVAAADRALYAAKRGGRDRVVCAPEYTREPSR